MPDGDTDKPAEGTAIRRRRSIPAEEVDAVLLRVQGNRDLAAKELGITRNNLKQKIRNSTPLRLRWSKREIWKRIGSMAASPTTTAPDPTTHMENQLDQLCNQLASHFPSMAAQVDALNQRIENGVKARISDDPEFKQKWAFKSNVRGEPTEEAMLREEYREMLDQIRKDAEAVAGISLKRAQTSSVMRKMMGGRSGRSGPAKPGFRPKGDRPLLITNSQVVVQNGKETESDG